MTTKIRASEAVLRWFYDLCDQDKEAVRSLLRRIKAGWEFGDLVRSWQGEGEVRYMKEYMTSSAYPHGIRLLYTVYQQTGVDGETLIAILNGGDHIKSALGKSVYVALTGQGRD